MPSASAVENHGRISHHPEVLVTILEASGGGALPDIGNFPDDESRARTAPDVPSHGGRELRQAFNPRFDSRSTCRSPGRETAGVLPSKLEATRTRRFKRFWAR